MEQDDADRVSAAYLRFAEDEVRDKSPLYGEFLRGVASDREVIGFLVTLPRHKRQPNLFLAAARYLFGTPAGWAQFRHVVLENSEVLRATMLARSTQTNEPGRCATLLPVLARLPEPLALIEVGASAGLCLFPDFYAYDYGGAILSPEAQGLTPPIFPLHGQCRDTGPGKTTPRRLEGRARSLARRPLRSRRSGLAGSAGVAGAGGSTGKAARGDQDCLGAAAPAGQRRPACRPRSARPRGAEGRDTGHLPYGGAA